MEEEPVSSSHREPPLHPKTATASSSSTTAPWSPDSTTSPARPYWRCCGIAGRPSPSPRLSSLTTAATAAPTGPATRLGDLWDQCLLECLEKPKMATCSADPCALSHSAPLYRSMCITTPIALCFTLQIRVASTPKLQSRNVWMDPCSLFSTIIASVASSLPRAVIANRVKADQVSINQFQLTNTA